MDGITDSLDMNLSKFWEMVKQTLGEEPGMMQSMGLQRVGHDLVTEQQHLLATPKSSRTRPI